jgi:hypothetical protein
MPYLAETPSNSHIQQFLQLPNDSDSDSTSRYYVGGSYQEHLKLPPASEMQTPLKATEVREHEYYLSSNLPDRK